VDASSSGKELAYAEITSSVTTTALGGANSVDATGLIINVPATTRPIEVKFVGAVGNTTAGDGIGINIVEGAAGDTVRTTVRQFMNVGTATAWLTTPIIVSVRLAASASARTFKVQYWATTGGTALILSTNSGQPASLSAVSR